MVTRITEGVYEQVSQHRWDKVKRLMNYFVDIEDKEKWGLERANMESIRGFLVYMSRTYWDMNPYLEGLHLNLDSRRPFRDNEGWKIQGEKPKLAEIDGKWDNVEE